jgi:peptidoglycan/LPS O-acetylase OafA/YrhL
MPHRNFNAVGGHGIPSCRAQTSPLLRVYLPRHNREVGAHELSTPTTTASAKQPALFDLSARIPELDGLRGIAIGMVLVTHYFGTTIQVAVRTPMAYALVPFRLLWSGVDLFFVLSGFLIGGILLDARDSSNYFRVFYTRRFFRIVPIYAVCLGAFFILYTLIRSGVAAKLSWVVKDELPWAPYLFFLQNLWMMKWNTSGALGLAVTWSLAIEEQFYLTLPLLIRILNPRRLVAFLGAGILMAPIFRIAFHLLRPSRFYPAYFVMMPCRADALLLGVLGAVVVRDARCRAWLSGHRKLSGSILALLALGFVVLDRSFPDLTKPVMYTIGLTWIAAFYLAALLYALSWRESVLSRFLRWKRLCWLGSIAYGVYLFHMFFLYAIFGSLWAGPPMISSFQTLCVILVALAVTLVFCRASWIYFERPLVRIGHRASYQFASTPDAPLAPTAPAGGV